MNKVPSSQVVDKFTRVKKGKSCTYFITQNLRGKLENAPYWVCTALNVVQIAIAQLKLDFAMSSVSLLSCKVDQTEVNDYEGHHLVQLLTRHSQRANFVDRQSTRFGHQCDENPLFPEGEKSCWWLLQVMKRIRDDLTMIEFVELACAAVHVSDREWICAFLIYEPQEA